MAIMTPDERRVFEQVVAALIEQERCLSAPIIRYAMGKQGCQVSVEAVRQEWQRQCSLWRREQHREK